MIGFPRYRWSLNSLLYNLYPIIIKTAENLEGLTGSVLLWPVLYLVFYFDLGLRCLLLLYRKGNFFAFGYLFFYQRPNSWKLKIPKLVQLPFPVNQISRRPIDRAVTDRTSTLSWTHQQMRVESGHMRTLSKRVRGRIEPQMCPVQCSYIHRVESQRYDAVSVVSPPLDDYGHIGLK